MNNDPQRHVRFLGTSTSMLFLKGYTRLLGKLAEITDSSIPVIFVGNHDMWMRNYFEQELNIPVYFEPKMYEWNQKRFFFISHGDGLGPGDHKYKMLKKVFQSRLCQWFWCIAPSWGIGLANYFSKKSVLKQWLLIRNFLGRP